MNEEFSMASASHSRSLSLLLKKETTFGDGGAPERSNASCACEMIRVSDGSESASDRVSAVSSCGAVRNAVLVWAITLTGYSFWKYG